MNWCDLTVRQMLAVDVARLVACGIGGAIGAFVVVMRWDRRRKSDAPSPAAPGDAAPPAPGDAAPLMCRTHGCEMLSVAIVYWPGQTTRLCGFCTMRLSNIAAAMGFDLVTAVDDGRVIDGSAAPGDGVPSPRTAEAPAEIPAAPVVQPEIGPRVLNGQQLTFVCARCSPGQDVVGPLSESPLPPCSICGKPAAWFRPPPPAPGDSPLSLPAQLRALEGQPSPTMVIRPRPPGAENTEAGRTSPVRPLINPASFPLPWWPKKG